MEGRARSATRTGRSQPSQHSRSGGRTGRAVRDWRKPLWPNWTKPVRARSLQASLRAVSRSHTLHQQLQGAGFRLPEKGKKGDKEAEPAELPWTSELLLVGSSDPQVHFFGASLSCCQRTARALESLGPVEGETSRWTTLRRFGLTLLMLPPSQRFRFRSAAERSRATESSREQIIILHYTKDTRGTKTSTPNFSVAAQELCSFAGIFRSVLFQRCVPAKLPCMGCMECACSIRTSSLKLAGAVSESAKLQQIATEYFPTARTFSLAEYSPGRFEFRETTQAHKHERKVHRRANGSGQASSGGLEQHHASAFACTVLSA